MCIRVWESFMRLLYSIMINFGWRDGKNAIKFPEDMRIN